MTNGTENVTSETGAEIPNPNQVEMLHLTPTDTDEDPNASYVKKARKILARLENTPMGSHETRLLKEAVLTIFGPAIEEAARHLKDE